MAKKPIKTEIQEEKPVPESTSKNTDTDASAKKTEPTKKPIKSVKKVKSNSSKNEPITVTVYLESISKKAWETGGLIAFANKKSKKKLQTPDEWKKLFAEY